MRYWMVVFYEGMFPFVTLAKNEYERFPSRIAMMNDVFDLPGGMRVNPKKYTGDIVLHVKMYDLPYPCILWYNNAYRIIMNREDFLEL